MITLVTGATGLVGNNVVRRLLEQGEGVRVLVRRTADPRPLAGLGGLEVVEGDVRDPHTVETALRGAARVVHAAARVHIGWTGMPEAQAINVEGTRNVARAARAAGARMVHVSSLDALDAHPNGTPADENSVPSAAAPNRGLCPYVVTKRQAEQVVLEHVDAGLHASIVNPGYMIGPFDWKPSSGRMLLSVARGWGLFAPRGVNCFCDVRDVAGGILAALDRGRPGRRYILGGHLLSYYQAWRIFAQVTGGTPPVLSIGPFFRSAAGRFGDLVRILTGREPDVNSASTALAAQKRIFTSARAQSELGYHPRPIPEAAAAAWRWFRAEGYV
jgi:dihydroflavonol-4-reductase